MSQVSAFIKGWQDADKAAMIAAWIRAEWHFRLGAQAYRGPTQDWLTDAEENLRELLTGHRELGAAAKALGVKDAEAAPKPRVRPAKDKPWQWSGYREAFGRRVRQERYARATLKSSGLFDR